MRAALLALAATAALAAEPALQLAMDAAGAASLRWHGRELLADGRLRVVEALLRSPTGELRPATLDGAASEADPASRHAALAWPWGVVSYTWSVDGDRARLDLAVTNRSPDTLARITLAPAALACTSAPAFDLGARKVTGRGGPGILGLAWDGGALAITDEDVLRPLYLGFPDRHPDGAWPLLIATGRDGRLPAGWLDSPEIDRAIPPGGSDRISLSLRCGPAGAGVADLAGDVYRRFAAAYPATLEWTDRRPIGALFLSSAERTSPTNPRGRFQDAAADFTGAAGIARFRERLLAFADDSIRELKHRGAQGAIVWDLEGQEFPHATSYIGDPRQLPPEMEPVADEFMRRLDDAGLRVGVCLRPQLPVRAVYGPAVRQQQVDDPVGVLIAKAAYARKRWGCTLFYVDSNVAFDESRKPDDAAAYQLMDAAGFRRLAAANPGCLFIPEHQDTAYYGVAAPYDEIRQDVRSTPESARRAYPRAFSVLSIADAPLEAKTGRLQGEEEVVAAVKRGDILLFRGWWPDPYNERVSAIYRAAAR